MNTVQQCDFCKRDMEGQKRPYHKECYGEAVSIFVPMSELSDKLKIAVEAIEFVRSTIREWRETGNINYRNWNKSVDLLDNALDKIKALKP